VSGMRRRTAGGGAWSVESEWGVGCVVDSVFGPTPCPMTMTTTITPRIASSGLTHEGIPSCCAGTAIFPLGGMADCGCCGRMGEVKGRRWRWKVTVVIESGDDDDETRGVIV
jgi:hypothetical protein